MSKDIKKSNLHMITVIYHKDGQEVAKKIPLADVDLVIEDGKTISLSEYLNIQNSRIAELIDEISNLKQYIGELVNADTEWKTKTNDVLKAILQRLDEQELIE